MTKWYSVFLRCRARTGLNVFVAFVEHRCDRCDSGSARSAMLQPAVYRGRCAIDRLNLPAQDWDAQALSCSGGDFTDDRKTYFAGEVASHCNLMVR